LLIVNADDWGIDAATTEAIAQSFTDGRVTSATAMVHMAGSARSASMARELGLPLGLHLNLSEPFNANRVPSAVRERQARLARRFDEGGRRRLRWMPAPTIRDDIEMCVRDQIDAFAELHGALPTHVDGHMHVHVSPTVARSPSLEVYALRRAVDDAIGAPGMVVLARRVRHRLTMARHVGTEHFLAIAQLGDELRNGRLPAALRRAETATVEVMAHPGASSERALLMTDAWKRSMARHRVGTYADLLS